MLQLHPSSAHNFRSATAVSKTDKYSYAGMGTPNYSIKYGNLIHISLISHNVTVNTAISNTKSRTQHGAVTDVHTGQPLAMHILFKNHKNVTMQSCKYWQSAIKVRRKSQWLCRTSPRYSYCSSTDFIEPLINPLSHSWCIQPPLIRYFHHSH